MFEKLLSLLPYNPGLAGQMAFYSQRMREESVIRRTGMVFLTLAFLIQFVAVISPPQETFAETDNDLITATSSSHMLSREQVADACQRDLRGYQKIMHYYGIHCDTIAAAETIDIHSSARDNSYYSMGHNEKSGADVDSVGISGAGTLHIRHLSTFTPSSWDALRVKNDAGETLYILLWCGNLVTVGLPHQSVFVPRGNDTATSDGGVGNPGDLGPGAPPLTGTAPQTTAPADTAPIPPEVNTPPNSTAILMCKYNFNIPDTSPDCPADCPYKAGIPVTNPQCYQPCPYNNAIPSDDDQCYEPCQYNGSISVEDESCKPCEKSVNAEDTVSCIDIRKTATNVTAGLADANNSTAKAGDVITYTLYAHNNGKATVKDFTFQENIGDVLDYANINDFHGATLDQYNVLTWASQDIKSDSTISVQITVKVKDPIPQTPASSGDPTRFNLVMTNVYGNTINIKLPGSPAKSIQAAAASLPNTGPGTSLFIGGAIVILGGYFYGRARLLAKESKLALQETAGA